MDNISQIAIIIGAIISAILGGLAYFNNKRNIQNEGSSAIVESAMKMLAHLNTLVGRISSLELENKNIRDQFKIISNENIILKDRITMLEKIMLENPIYRMLFLEIEIPSLILYTKTGKIFNVNKAFTDLYGYNETELMNMTVYDISLEIDSTKTALEHRVKYVGNRLHKTKTGMTLSVSVSKAYYNQDDVEYCLCVYNPRNKASLSTRVNDLLSEIITNYDSDYSTVWCILNHNRNRLSGIYEIAKQGNPYLFQNYRDIPSTLFQELFLYLDKNEYVVIPKTDENFQAVRYTLEHSGLDCILISPVKSEDNKMIGLLTTSWKDCNNSKVDELSIAKFIKYSKSDLVREAVITERDL